jgi:hypothetical protein
MSREGRFSDTRFDAKPVSIRAWKIRSTASLDRIAFKEEVGDQPLDSLAREGV